MLPKPKYTEWGDLVPNLEIGDIVLISNVLPTSRMIKFFTNSYWSHVGLVFDILHPDSKNRIALVIEAIDQIEIHRLRVYMNNLGTRRIGFKRFPGLTDEQRQKIRGFFLENVDMPYDWNRIYSYLASGMIARLSGIDVSAYLTRKGITVENFVCSTFVQRAFYLALPAKERDRAIFRRNPKLNLLEQLEVCSPSDIARSENVEWLWNPHY